MSNKVQNDIFTLNDINFEIDESIILTNISTNIEKEGITGIIGPSGSGKSTFLRLLNRLISPSSGNIFLKGINTKNISPRSIRKEVGLVQQKPYLFPGSVRYNLLYGPKIWDIALEEKDLINLLKKVDLSSEFLDRDVDSLSGGEQQRVNLARILANKPIVLLLDEPTSSLDVISEEIVEKTLNLLNKEDMKIIIVTHSLEQTKRITNQIIFLKDGKLVKKMKTEEFFKKYSDSEVREFFRTKNSQLDSNQEREQ